MKPRCALAALVALGVLTVSATAQTVASVYTDFDTRDCHRIPNKEVDEYGAWSCVGYGGIRIFYVSVPQHIYISYGPRAEKELANKETLASTNYESGKIEWRGQRSADGKFKPYATIMRWHTEQLDSNDKEIKGQVLVVTRLGPGGVCHVGYVDGRANTDANALAQKIADENARKFKCGADKPIVMGNKGPGFSGPDGN